MEEKFNNLINDIYSITIFDKKVIEKKVNIISCLAIIFKHYINHHHTKHSNNVITIIVGGAPADVIHSHYNELPVVIKDVDIATNLLPKDIENSIRWYNNLENSNKFMLFGFDIKLHLLEKINLTSKDNGTINVYVDHSQIPIELRKLEITTFRSESGQRGQHKMIPVGLDISYNDGIIIDCERRDLTIGIGFFVIDTTNLEVFQSKLFGELNEHHIFKTALSDIQYGLVRFMGDPYMRIYEDGVRMLRLIRKSGKLKHHPHIEHFNICLQLLESLHKPITIPINDMILELKPISKERILHCNDGELVKLLKLDNFLEILSLIYQQISKLQLENIHYLYLPKIPNIKKLHNKEWKQKNTNPFNVLASLYIDNYKDNGIKQLSLVGYTILGENIIIFFYLLLMTQYIKENDFKTSYDICLYSHNLNDILGRYAKQFNIKQLLNIKNKHLYFLNILFDFNCDIWNNDFCQFIKQTINDFNEKKHNIEIEIYKNDSIVPKQDRIKHKITQFNQLLQQMKD